MAAVYQTPGLLGLVEPFIYRGKDRNYRPTQEEFMQDKLAKGFETFTASESETDERTGRFTHSSFSPMFTKCQCGLE